MKVRYLVEIDVDPNERLDQFEHCLWIQGAVAVAFHRLAGQVKAEPYTLGQDIEKLKNYELYDLAKEGYDSLHSFKLYEPAIAGRGNMYPLHNVGVQTLSAGAVRNAADFWRRCEGFILRLTSLRVPELRTEPPQSPGHPPSSSQTS